MNSLRRRSASGDCKRGHWLLFDERQQPVVNGLACKFRLAYAPPSECMGGLYRAIDDPIRRATLDELVERDGQSLFELCGRLIMKHGIGSSRQAISQHPEVLQSAGFVIVRREGKYNFHWFNGEPFIAISKRWPTNGQRS